MRKYEFEAEIKKHSTMNAAYIEFPYEVEKEFGTRGQVKVKATFDGHPYRGSLAKMGHHCHCLGVTQKMRKALGKNPGETIDVVLQKDEEPRTVEVPAPLKEWLNSHSGEKQFFEALSYTNQKEYVQWITGAKKEETRDRRLNKAFELLASRVKHP